MGYLLKYSASNVFPITLPFCSYISIQFLNFFLSIGRFVHWGFIYSTNNRLEHLHWCFCYISHICGVHSPRYQCKRILKVIKSSYRNGNRSSVLKCLYLWLHNISSDILSHSTLMNVGKVANFESLVSVHCSNSLECVLIMKTSCFNTDFASQMK